MILIKRSEINQIMKDTVEFAKEMNFLLPPFAYWNAKDWEDKGEEYDEIRDNLLGWDITDFGSGDYRREGLLMFTIRNGNFSDPKYVKPYAEKMLIVEEGQVTPYHFHYKKMEDIINRGGGNLIVTLYNATKDEEMDDTPVLVSKDGRNYMVPAGEEIRVYPGESISLHAGVYHSFWGEKGTGRILVGEVSKVNDDRVDNRFYKSVGRFPAIEEDEPPYRLLCNEYPAAK